VEGVVAKNQKRIKPRNPLAVAVKTDPAFHQRKVTKPSPKDYKPEIEDFDDD
jgi:hypothetical protein